MRDVVDVDAARGDIGCNQHARRALAEAFKRCLPRALALVAVDGVRGDTDQRQVARDAIGATLGAREDDDALQRWILQQSRQCSALMAVLDEVDALFDAIDGLAGVGDLDANGVVQQFGRQ